jgi:hypothetical protein
MAVITAQEARRLRDRLQTLREEIEATQPAPSPPPAPPPLGLARIVIDFKPPTEWTDREYDAALAAMAEGELLGQLRKYVRLWLSAYAATEEVHADCRFDTD